MRLPIVPTLALFSTASAILAVWLTRLPWYLWNQQLFYISGASVDPHLPMDYDLGTEFLFVYPTMVLIGLNLTAYLLVFLRRFALVSAIFLVLSLGFNLLSLYFLVITHLLTGVVYLGNQYLAGAALVIAFFANGALLLRLFWSSALAKRSLVV